MRDCEECARTRGRMIGPLRTLAPRLPLIALLLALTTVPGLPRGLRPAIFHLPAPDEISRSPAAQRLRAGAAGANLFIISLDAAAAEHFTSFGYTRNTTPNLARFFADSILLTQAYAAAAGTKPSVTSLFTSQFPDTHGTLSRLSAMTTEGTTLAESLRAAGYTTGAFSASPSVAACFGFNRGFDSFHEVFRDVGLHPAGGRYPTDTGATPVDATLVLRAVTDWLAASPREPFFAYLHFREPHFPYGAPPGFQPNLGRPRRTRAGVVCLQYDRGLCYVDSVVGQLLTHLRAAGLLDRSVVIVMADHGEAFQEHRLSGHETSVYREMVHIPVAFHLPRRCGAAPRRRSEVFSSTDIMPTLLDLFGLPPAQTMQGRSRLPLLAGEEETTPAVAVSRAFRDNVGGSRRPELVSYGLRAPRYTLILSDLGRRVELYDRDTDPAEKQNLAGRKPEVVRRLRRDFVAWAATQRGRPVVLPQGSVFAASSSGNKMDEQTRRQLKALGYLK